MLDTARQDSGGQETARSLAGNSCLTGRRATLWLLATVGWWPLSVSAAAVTQLQATHRDGQTFITWMDAGTATEGTRYRYTLYRATAPITQSSLGTAKAVQTGILPYSGKQFGYAFKMTDRADPTKPMSVISPGGAPLPLWSGLAVHTARATEKAYYAVVARDTATNTDLPVVVGSSALATPVQEAVAPMRPIRLHTAQEKGYTAVAPTGAAGLPLMLALHASNAEGGPASVQGDYYAYFGDADMGYQDGLQSAFSIQEFRLATGARRLQVNPRDTLVRPNGNGGVETYWFGNYVSPQGAADPAPRAHPTTEKRLDWLLQWSIANLGADPHRIYASGQSMGGWGVMSYALHRPQRFAAVFPVLPRPRQSGLVNLAPLSPPVATVTKESGVNPLLPDAVTPYFDQVDSVKYVQAHHEDLPFIGWAIGRQDNFAPWRDQVDLVRALTANHHGFAFSWNNGNHSDGPAAMAVINQGYPPELFALNRSYPAFGNSSIDDNIGNGDPAHGDLVGGINLGFSWSGVVDQPAQWSAQISNSRAMAPMTVDVTPRRLQSFKLVPGETVAWTNSAGGSGTVQVDASGRATIAGMVIRPNQPSTLTLTKSTLAGFDFSLASAANRSVVAGQSVAMNLSATLVSGLSQATTFAAQGLPPGTTATYSAPGCVPSCTSTMTVQTTAATPAGAYPVTVTAAGGGISRAAQFMLTVTAAPSTADTAAPSTPATPLVRVVSTNSISLIWRASTDNVGVTGYRIYRDGVEVGTSTTPEFFSAGLQANARYSYTVAAYDAAGNLSARSASVAATTVATGPQASPQLR